MEMIEVLHEKFTIYNSTCETVLAGGNDGLESGGCAWPKATSPPVDFWSANSSCSALWAGPGVGGAGNSCTGDCEGVGVRIFTDVGDGWVKGGDLMPMNWRGDGEATGLVSCDAVFTCRGLFWPAAKNGGPGSEMVRCTRAIAAKGSFSRPQAVALTFKSSP